MKTRTTPLYNIHQPAGISEGMIIIPDISGYTNFVRNSDVITGRNITYELLSTIIKHNILDLQVSEIEGDAVLFYKYGPPPPVSTILEQYEVMLAGFNEKLKQINKRFGRNIDLSLKLVAHYGLLTEFSIGGFRKLYGEAVIEAHRLLKNALRSRSYALLTDELVAVARRASAIDQPLGMSGSKLCAVYGGLRNICFTYFDYEPDIAEKLTA